MTTLTPRSTKGASTRMPTGAFTALVTPFHNDAPRSIDWDAFDALVDAQIGAGISALVPCGTTGESPTLTSEERVAVIARTVERARGRVPVFAGTGSNSTRASIDASMRALDVGASGVMLVVPYYNKPTQAGLEAHFIECARAVRAPVIIYNIPSRCMVDMLPDAVARVCDAAENVVAMKEATGNVLRAQELVRRFGERLAVFSGDDTLTLPMMSVGGVGVISVTSNAYPAEIVALTKHALAGDFASARAMHLSLLPVHDAMFVESNPVPVKVALAEKGRMAATVRLPLVQASDESQKRIRATMAQFSAATAAFR